MTRYLYAPDQAEELVAALADVEAEQAVAVEDSVPGARLAVAAGLATVGNVTFISPGERDACLRELFAGAAVAVSS